MDYVIEKIKVLSPSRLPRLATVTSCQLRVLLLQTMQLPIENWHYNLSPGIIGDTLILKTFPEISSVISGRKRISSLNVSRCFPHFLIARPTHTHTHLFTSPVSALEYPVCMIFPLSSFISPVSYPVVFCINPFIPYSTYLRRHLAYMLHTITVLAPSTPSRTSHALN